jgi:hypothetical protein
MQETIAKMEEVIANLQADFAKIKVKNNQAAGARARKNTLLLEKLGKQFRKESVKELGY